MRQVETSRTLVFDAPRHARGFFEALVADNLDIGRPELIELVFRRGQRRGRPAAGQFKAKILAYGGLKGTSDKRLGCFGWVLKPSFELAPPLVNPN